MPKCLTASKVRDERGASAVRFRATLAACLAALGLLARGATAQAVQPGPVYEHPFRPAFQIRVPRDWEFIPPQPDDPFGIGTYTPPAARRYVYLSGRERLFLHAWLIQFDREALAAACESTPLYGALVEAEPSGAALEELDSEVLLQRWIDSRVPGVAFAPVSSRDCRSGGTRWSELTFAGRNATAEDDAGSEVRLYAALFELEPGLDVALVANGPAGRKWSRYHKSYRQLARSFRPIAERESAEPLPRLGSGSVRAQRRLELERETAGHPGWELYETPHYFVVTNADDRDFVDEVCARLEALRALFERDLPPERSVALRRRAEQARYERAHAAMLERGETPPRPTSVAYGSVEADSSRAGVVRVCADRAQYLSYGGAPGTSGYWNAAARELVLYDDMKENGRAVTWAVLSHEAFHQYFDSFFGELDPGPWYEEGLADYYGAFRFEGDAMVEDGSDARLGPLARRPRMRRAARENTWVPLESFVEFTKRDYCGSNFYGIEADQNYAQGWSLVYFLRTGAERARGFRPEWAGLLERYLDELAVAEDGLDALDALFAEVDWDALERAWLDYSR